MNFYTADPHFFHENILKFCNRPFQTVDALNRHILSNYQSVMTSVDDLWILGDVAVVHVDAAPELSAMLASIPGRKHLVTGILAMRDLLAARIDAALMMNGTKAA